MAKAGEIVAKLRLDISDYKKNIDTSKKELAGFSSATAKIAKASVTAIATIATAMAGVATAGGKMAIEQEANMAKMQASTGATTEEMEKFKESADTLFANGRGDFGQIYDTLSLVKQVLGQTGSEAEKTADQSLMLSKVFGWDVAESIRAVDSAQKAWGGTSEETFDIFTSLAQQAGDKSDDLLDTFNEYAPILGEAGYSMEDFGDILKTGMDEGAFNFDKIGDALKEFNVRLTDGSTQANGLADQLFGTTDASNEFFAGISDGSTTGAEALKIITGKLSEIEDPIERNTLGVGYFGSMWEDLGGNVVMAMGNAEDSLENVEGATARTGQALADNIGAKITKIKNQFILWTKEIGENMLPTLDKFVDLLLDNLPEILATAEKVFEGVGNAVLSTIETIKDLTEFVEENKEMFMVLGGTILGFLVPIMVGYASITVPLVLKAIGLQMTAFTGLIAKYWNAGLALMGLSTNMMLAFGVIGLLVAGALLLWKNWDLVTAKLAEFGITSESVSAYIVRLKDNVLALWESFKGSSIFPIVAGYVQGLVDKFVALYNGIKSVITSGDFTPLLEAVTALFPVLIGLFLGGIPRLLVVGSNLLKAVADGMGITVPELVTKITDIIVQMIEQFAILLPAFIETGVALLLTLIEGLVQALPGLIEAIISVVDALVETFITLLPVIVETGIEILMAVIDGIIDTLPFLLGAILGIVIALVATLIDNLPKIIDAGVKILFALIDGIIKILPSLISTALVLITTIFGALITALPSIIEAGIRILNALIDGIIKILPQLIATGLKLIWQLAKILIQNAPEILSAGVKLIWALIKGVLSMLGSVGSAIDDVGSAILDKIGEISLVDIGKDIIRGLWNGISNMTGWITGKLDGFGESVMGGIKDFFGIHSPSRVFRDEIGVMLVRGLDVGMQKMKDLPIDTLADISKNMVDSFNPELTANAVGIVDSIVDGASALKNVVGNLGFEVATPKLAGLAGDFGNVYPDTMPVQSGDGGTNYNAPIVHVENMNVRDDSDVRQVSKELFNLQRSHDRSNGGK